MNKFVSSDFPKTDLKYLGVCQFLKQTNEKALRRRIDDMVNLAQKGRQTELQQKRQRLMALLLKEDCQYENEYIQFRDNQAKEEFNAKQQRIMENRAKERQKNEDLIQLKRAQQHLNNCETVRQRLSDDITQHTKQCQLLQIAEKKQKGFRNQIM